MSTTRTLPDAVLNANTIASGSLTSWRNYYTEASKIVNQMGSLDPNLYPVINELKHILEQWQNHDLEWSSQIEDASRDDNADRIRDYDYKIKKESYYIKEYVIQIYDSTNDKPIRDKIFELFNIEAVETERTQYLKELNHYKIVELCNKWLENKRKSLGLGISSNIIHNMREAGIDIIVNTPELNMKFGIQIKSNNDVKEENFERNVKAQITDSKKHDIKGLIIILAADMTEKSVEIKVKGLISDLDQLKGESIIIIPPEKLVTLLKEVEN